MFGEYHFFEKRRPDRYFFLLSFYHHQEQQQTTAVYNNVFCFKNPVCRETTGAIYILRNNEARSRIIVAMEKQYVLLTGQCV
jgi:hypothetical protein